MAGVGAVSPEKAGSNRSLRSRRACRAVRCIADTGDALRLQCDTRDRVDDEPPDSSRHQIRAGGNVTATHGITLTIANWTLGSRRRLFKWQLLYFRGDSAYFVEQFDGPAHFLN
jgi:hypothetical protein